jgi:hypothetical protein
MSERVSVQWSLWLLTILSGVVFIFGIGQFFLYLKYPVSPVYDSILTGDQSGYNIEKSRQEDEKGDWK